MKVSCYLGNFLDFNGEKNEQVVYSSRYDARIVERKKKHFYRVVKNREHKAIVSRLNIVDPAIPMFNEVRVNNIPRELLMVHYLEMISSGDTRYDIDEIKGIPFVADPNYVFVNRCMSDEFERIPNRLKKEIIYILSCYTYLSYISVEDYSCGEMLDADGKYKYHKITIKIRRCRFTLFIKIYSEENYSDNDFVLVKL